jgi:hypothetical protein
MKSKTRRIILAVAVIGVLAAGGAAFTAANSFTTPDVAGYATQAVTGAVISDQQNNLTTDGSQITSVDLVFALQQDPAKVTVKAGFDDDLAGLTTCTDTNAGVDTHYNCVSANTANVVAPNDELTANAVNFAVSVTNN